MALPTKLVLEVVTPDRLVLREDVDEVVVPGSEGELGVLPGHTPLLATLKVGEMWYRTGSERHYLAVAIDYLYRHRDGWLPNARVGKTMVSSSMIDRVVASLGRELWEVPVGFKWFVDGLFDGSLGFGGEESAGASFLRRDGSVWSTDKDGLILALLSAEITARTGRDPGEHYRDLVGRFGDHRYVRIDQPLTLAEKERFKFLTPTAITATSLAGDPIEPKFSEAPGNRKGIGGVKVTTSAGWFAARPSGTEAIYKLYAESFRDDAHLNVLVSEARGIVTAALAGS